MTTEPDYPRAYSFLLGMWTMIAILYRSCPAERSTVEQDKWLYYTGRINGLLYAYVFGWKSESSVIPHAWSGINLPPRLNPYHSSVRLDR